MIGKQDGEAVELIFFSETIVEFGTESNRMVGIVGGSCRTEPWNRDHRRMQLEI